MFYFIYLVAFFFQILIEIEFQTLLVFVKNFKNIRLLDWILLLKKHSEVRDEVKVKKKTIRFDMTNIWNWLINVIKFESDVAATTCTEQDITVQLVMT